MKKHLIALAVLGSLFVAFAAFGGEPGWERGVIKFGAERRKVQNTEILNRSYRPLHVYGNTVRRRHYRSRGLPSVRGAPRAIRR